MTPAGRLAAVALATVCACAAPGSDVAGPAPEPAASVARPAPPERPVIATGPDSARLAAFYGRVERQLLARGLLRRDGGGRDTPYSAERLADTFLKLALFDEFGGADLTRAGGETRLQRYAAPVRIELRFGDSVPDAVRAADRAGIVRLAERLSQASGHPVRLTTGDTGNMVVWLVSEAERRALGPALRAYAPGLGPRALATLRDLPVDSYCAVLNINVPDSWVTDRAIVIVRAEHPDLLRLSCYHEEIAQGMGLANDAPDARPSIFNDDEEFALLTRMDEDLLRILYDRRLRPGMTRAEAAPIVRAIADEIGGSGG